MSPPGDGGRPAGDAASLESDARALGLDAHVSADGALAIVRLRSAHGDPDVPLLDADQRAALVAAARSHGFTHVALELNDAAVRGAGAPR